MGNSDAHSAPQIIGFPQTVVFATGLNRAAILGGIAAGRSYIAESQSVTVAVTASAGRHTAGLGDYLGAAPADPVTLSVHIAGVPHATVRLITDEGQTLQTSLPASGGGVVPWATTPQTSAYVRVEVRHPLADGTPGSGSSISTVPTLGPMAAMTNPVWLGQAARRERPD